MCAYINGHLFSAKCVAVSVHDWLWVNICNYNLFPQVYRMQYTTNMFEGFSPPLHCLHACCLIFVANILPLLLNMLRFIIKHAWWRGSSNNHSDPLRCYDPLPLVWYCWKVQACSDTISFTIRICKVSVSCLVMLEVVSRWILLYG